MLKGCGGGSDVCRFLAAYDTATKAEQKFNIANGRQPQTLTEIYLINSFFLTSYKKYRCHYLPHTELMQIME